MGAVQAHRAARARRANSSHRDSVMPMRKRMGTLPSVPILCCSTNRKRDYEAFGSTDLLDYTAAQMRGRTVRSVGRGAERVSGTHASNAALVLLRFVTVAGADGIAVLFDVFLYRARPD